MHLKVLAYNIRFGRFPGENTRCLVKLFVTNKTGAKGLVRIQFHPPGEIADSLGREETPTRINATLSEEEMNPIIQLLRTPDKGMHLRNVSVVWSSESFGKQLTSFGLVDRT